jgi:hypothetical protein
VDPLLTSRQPQWHGPESVFGRVGGAPGGELPGDRAPQAVGGAGEQDRSVTEIGHGVPFGSGGVTRGVAAVGPGYSTLTTMDLSCWYSCRSL